MPPNRSEVTRDNNPEWRGGNPHYEYYRQLIQKRMEKIGMFKGKNISEMTRDELLEFATWAGKELERRLVVDFTTHTDEFNPCGKPHNNKEEHDKYECETCQDNMREVIKENI